MAQADTIKPFLISWNITSLCNLRCAHCYIDANEVADDSECAAGVSGPAGHGGPSTEEALSTVERIAAEASGAMLILTGGEPLLRPDIYDIIAHASTKGLTVVVGTNGTLVDDNVAGRLREAGAAGAGVSIDSPGPEYHDQLRGAPGAWERAMRGIDALASAGLDHQVQFTVTRANRAFLPEMVELARAKGARALNVFFLVCTGRGHEMTDLTADEYEETLEYIERASADQEKGKVMVRARCAPHILRVAETRDPEGALARGATSGCIAGRGYMRITPEGVVTPCPYIPPAEGAPTVADAGLMGAVRLDPRFAALASPEYNGKCGRCEFKESCGGCRARALASSGKDAADLTALMGEDPWCAYTPEEQGNTVDARAGGVPAWTTEAAERLGRVPAFLRPMVKKGVERYASSRGVAEITPALMAELKGRTGRGS